MKVLVTGASGLLGHDVCRELCARGIPYQGFSSKNVDLTDEKRVISYLHACQPDCVIHCAAYTAVDAAEDDEERCSRLNTDATRTIARCCQELGAKMLYISTDYVFSGEGDTPYEVDAPTGPLNVYGRTKLLGELAVREELERYYIVRISWVFGIHGKNFVRTMLDLGKANSALRITGDQIGSPSYTRDLAKLFCDMIVTDSYGTYHATNEGYCSWAEYAQEIFDQAGMPVTVTPRAAAERLSRAERPHNSRLSKASLDQHGFSRLPTWQNALARYLQELRDTADL